MFISFTYVHMLYSISCNTSLGSIRVPYSLPFNHVRRFGSKHWWSYYWSTFTQVETKRCTRKIDRFVKLSPKKACRYLANVFKKKNFFANYSRNYKIINIYSYLFQASFRRGAIEKRGKIWNLTEKWSYSVPFIAWHHALGNVTEICVS